MSTPTPGGLKVKDLKTRIDRGEYEIDSREVAEAMITKLRTVSRVRAQLDAPSPGRNGRRFQAALAWPGERELRAR